MNHSVHALKVLGNFSSKLLSRSNNLDQDVWTYNF